MDETRESLGYHDELKLLNGAINTNDISENEMSKRKELYLSCFDDYTGRAVDRYTETIQKVILKANDLD